jgi:hypothetical protein
MTTRLARCALILLLLVPLAVRAQTQPSATGLDAISDDKLMNELAARGMTTLLDRAFEVNKIPRAQQEGRRALIALQQLTDPSAKLSARQKQELITRVTAGIEQALPSIRDAETLMQQAQVLIHAGSDPLVNTLEYWGETPATQAQLRPIAEVVEKLFERAGAVASDELNAAASKVRGPQDPAAARLDQLEKLANIATYNARMSDYTLAISIDRADPRRREIAQRAIDYLKDLDVPEESVRPAVRLQIAKLSLLIADYGNARKLFDSLTGSGGVEQITPKPDFAQLYQAHYFRAIADVLDGKDADAQKSLDALVQWQRTNLPNDPGTQQSIAAATSILQYRIHALQAQNARDPNGQRQANAAAAETLTNLLRDRPDLQSVVSELLVSRLPQNADLGTVSPLMLSALLKRGESEAIRPEDQKADDAVLRRAVAAAEQIIHRATKPGGGIGAADAEHAQFVLPFLLQRLSRAPEAASAFLDYVEKYKDAEHAKMALDYAQSIIGELHKNNPNDEQVRRVYERFLKTAIDAPFNRKQFAFEYARQLQLLNRFADAIHYYEQVPPDDKRLLAARFFQMIASKQLLDTLPPSDPQRGPLMSSIQTLAAEVTKAAQQNASTGSDDQQRSIAQAMIVRTQLLAADLARVDQKDPNRALGLLENFEASAKGQPNEQGLLSEALLIRVQSFMALGRNNEATDALVKLLKTREGGQGAAIVYSLLEKLNADFDKAQNRNDRESMRVLARNRAELSGFLVDWAKDNPDANIKKYTYRYRVFQADTKQRAAELEEDAATRKAGLEEALKLYQALETPDAQKEYVATTPPGTPPEKLAYDPAVVRGIALIEYALGNYAEAQPRLARLLNDGRMGAGLREVDENGQVQTIDNDTYWEAVLKLIRSNLALNAEPEAQKQFLRVQYIRWGSHVGGTRWKAEFDKLRQELIPDFNPESPPTATTEPATAASALPATAPTSEPATKPAARAD